jgi:hypothetical protein
VFTLLFALCSSKVSLGLRGVGSGVGQPGTLSMLLKVLSLKPIECKMHLGAIRLGVCLLN